MNSVLFSSSDNQVSLRVCCCATHLCETVHNRAFLNKVYYILYILSHNYALFALVSGIKSQWNTLKDLAVTWQSGVNDRGVLCCGLFLSAYLAERGCEGAETSYYFRDVSVCEVTSYCSGVRLAFAIRWAFPTLNRSSDIRAVCRWVCGKCWKSSRCLEKLLIKSTLKILGTFLIWIFFLNAKDGLKLYHNVCPKYFSCTYFLCLSVSCLLPK